ncbi:MAG: hypothetical protein CMH55_06775 [Myxococcales bacterium]|nr:hypothetical protein [Myxococcales bacterium]
MMHRRLQQGLKRFRDEESGAALTEFAVMAPVIIVLLFFAWYFVDLVQLKLDTQEMARMVTWDAINRPMHDYDEGQHDGVIDQAAAGSVDAVRRMYANLDATRNGNEMPRDFTIERRIEAVEAEVADGPAANNPLIDQAFPSRGEMQTRVQTSALGIDDFFPHNFLVGRRFNDNPFAPMRRVLRFEENYRLLAGSWRLHDGRDVRPGEGDARFTKQVGRVAFGGDMADTVQSFGQLFAALAALVGADTNPMEVQVASLNYGMAAFGRGEGPESGRIEQSVSGGQSRFDTAPMRTDDEDGSGSVYGRTLQARGEHYMGCPRLVSEAECFR